MLPFTKLTSGWYGTAYLEKFCKGNLKHEALVFSFKIPEDDRNQILYEHDETNFQRSGKKTKFEIIGVY